MTGLDTSHSSPAAGGHCTMTSRQTRARPGGGFGRGRACAQGRVGLMDVAHPMPLRARLDLPNSRVLAAAPPGDVVICHTHHSPCGCTGIHRAHLRGQQVRQPGRLRGPPSPGQAQATRPLPTMRRACSGLSSLQGLWVPLSRQDPSKGKPQAHTVSCMCTGTCAQPVCKHTQAQT